MFYFKTKHIIPNIICTLYFILLPQYLACILIFIIDCPGLVYKVNSRESFNELTRLMISFLEKGAKHLDQMYTQRQPAGRLFSGYVHFFSVSVNSVKEFMEAMISNNEKLMDSQNTNQDVFYGSEQILSLTEISEKAQNWCGYIKKPSSEF